MTLKEKLRLTTDLSRLRRLLETLADPKTGPPKRHQAGAGLRDRFPPKRRTDLYARLLREPSLGDEARWAVMLMLFYVGNEPAVEGLSAFVRDPAMSKSVKSNALMLLVGLNAKEALRAAEAGARFLLPWLRHGARMSEPRMPAAERRRLVIEALLVDLFDEKEE